jgi:CubicO group peptidase (beta-lactamase class C family)
VRLRPRVSMSEPGAGVTYSDLGFVPADGESSRPAAPRPFEAFTQREVFDAFGMSGARVRADRRSTRRGGADRDDTFARRYRARFRARRELRSRWAASRGTPACSRPRTTCCGSALRCSGGGAVRAAARARGDGDRPAGFGDDTTRGWGSSCSATAASAARRCRPARSGTRVSPGTSLWCDPQHDLCVVLAQQPRASDPRQQQDSRRATAVHDLVLGSLR